MIKQWIRNWLNVEEWGDGFIGEVFWEKVSVVSSSYFRQISTNGGPEQNISYGFSKFKGRDISERRNSELKINGVWVERWQVIFYDEDIQIKRDAIRKIFEEKFGKTKTNLQRGNSL